MKPLLIRYSIAIAILSILMALALSGLAREAGDFWLYQNPDRPLPSLTKATPTMMRIVAFIPLALLVMAIVMFFPSRYREKLLLHSMAITCLILLVTGFITLVSVFMPAIGPIIVGPQLSD